MKVKQAVVDVGCETSLKKYDALSIAEAQMQFSYDLQGFLASMNNRKEWTLTHGIIKVTQLLNIIAMRNEL